MTAFEFDVRQLLACSWSCFREFCFTFTRTSQYLYLDSFETRTGWLSVSLRVYSKCSSKLKFKSSNSNGFMIACIEKLSLWDVRQCPAITSDLIKLSDACLGEIQRLRCKSELLLALHNVHTMIMNETKLECREYVSFAAVKGRRIRMFWMRITIFRILLLLTLGLLFSLCTTNETRSFREAHARELELNKKDKRWEIVWEFIFHLELAWIHKTVVLELRWRAAKCTGLWRWSAQRKKANIKLGDSLDSQFDK